MAPGKRLGPYEILAPLGAGGMGEVYKAKDTRLDRTVAVKVLAAQLSQDTDVKQRFEREARAISSLSHPHICALYDVGSEDGVEYLVMELLEGETLAERLTKGALPPAQVLRFGVEIAEALGAAHRRGIVHRDLKPGNVMLTKSGVKLLDFGLAKEHAGGVTDIAETQTKSIGSLTGKGTILGTLQYMAPEQLEGKEADSRTDIFALGSLLYEMATGKKVFSGSSHASLISAILKDEPSPISRIQPMTPPALDHVVKKCFSKDPDERWQSAQDIASQLKWISEGSSQAGITTPVVSPTRTRPIIWILLASLAVAVALLSATLYWRVPASEPRLVRFAIPPPEKSSFEDSIALSPDGRRLAFVASTAGKASLWLRSLDSIAPQQLPGTEDASRPFWSPDGRWIGFFAAGKLKKIDDSGGFPQTLCDAYDNRGGTWSREGVILFTPNSGDGLYRVSADGGAAVPVTRLDTAAGENSHRWPCFLPDGRHFLYLDRCGRPDRSGIWVGSLDSKDSRRLLASGSDVFYSRPGFLIYVNEETLMSQPFDATRLELKGPPVPLAEQIWGHPTIIGLNAFATSEDGVLAYRTGGIQKSQFVWFDRNGRSLGAVGAPGRYTDPCFSGDQKQIVFTIDNYAGIADLETMDVTTGNASRYTFHPSHDSTALWSPDGERIVWTSSRSGPQDLQQKAANGAGNDELLLKSSANKFPDDWSLDGKFILYENADPKTQNDLWVLPMLGDRKPVPYLQTEFNESHARFSPDGKWVAYASDESGKSEVYAQSFPATGGKWQISSGGGDQPQWRRDGKELFYVTLDGKLMAAEVSTTVSTFQKGASRSLFGLHVVAIGITSTRNCYLAAADGQRFLVNSVVEDATPYPITVVLDWTALLKR